MRLCVVIFAAFLMLGMTSVDNKEKKKDPRLKCERYENPQFFLMCEQIKATQEMADVLKRVEEKLPNFKDF